MDQRSDITWLQLPNWTCSIGSGGGDGFAAGFFYGLLTGADPDESCETGMGTWRAPDDLPRRHDDGYAGTGPQFRKGGSARIQR